MKNIFLILVTIFSFYISNAQDCSMQIGTNFAGIDAQVFKDLKKSSSHLFTQNVVYLANDSNYWDTGLIDSIPTDINGYPTIDIPFEHSSVDTSQTYHFLVATNTFYPTGHYIMSFDGTGTIELSHWSDATNITFPNANTIEFDILSNANGIHITVVSSQASDYIRNITIVHQDDLSSFHTQAFREELVELSKDFECLRFMDWMGTNQATWGSYDTTTLIWADRVPKGKHRVYDGEGGMSYEHIIEFTNEVNKDAWINIPHLADSNYIYQLATMFKNGINTDLKIYVEFSNEVWNSIFDQTIYVEENGPYGNNLQRNYAFYSTKTFKIFEEVFGSERDRLKFVMAGLDWSLLDAVPFALSLGAEIDYVSYPGYFNLGTTGWANLDALGAAATAQDVITEAQNNMSEDFFWLKSFKTLVSDSNNIEFIMYEGGQHLLRMFGVQEPFQQALYDAQLSPEMGDLYDDFLSFCRDSLEVKLFNHYNLYGPNESNYGSWGMVESVFATPNTPKYDALMRFQCVEDTIVEPIDTIIEPIDTTGVGVLEVQNVNVKIYPNPSNGTINIAFEDNFEGKICIMNLSGQTIKEKSINSKTCIINLENTSKGIYFIQGTSKNKHFIQKVNIYK